jgi:hypothetical protein
MQSIVASVIVAVVLAGQATGLDLPKVCVFNLVEP